ncbi:cytochrome, seed isoform [Sesamum alatum]|uniref:Cytochrome, seed isoform n=1 Tax=Sesamum alatum TaxID=300844 RepID=A0AAE1Y7V5_9LAMI|nr:cytochrome, seed isoform [Sesamum alatum]
MGAESKVFTHSQVSAHNTSEDCWVIINAKDASEEFEDVGHGSAARLMLDEFYVGEVDPSTTNVVDATLGSIKDVENKPLESTNKLLYFVLALVIIVLGLGIHFFKLLS